MSKRQLSNSNYGLSPVKIPPEGGTPSSFVQDFSSLEFRLQAVLVIIRIAWRDSNSRFGVFPRRTTRRSSLQMQEINAFSGKWRDGLRPDRCLEAKKKIMGQPYSGAIFRRDRLIANSDADTAYKARDNVLLSLVCAAYRGSHTATLSRHS